jgi:hypothetical protein
MNRPPRPATYRFRPSIGAAPVSRLICLAFLAAALSGCVRIQVSNRFPGCRFERECGALLGVDCESAVDGPYLYVQKSDLKVVATCGGACMSGSCTNCPPKEWTCSTY